MTQQPSAPRRRGHDLSGLAALAAFVALAAPAGAHANPRVQAPTVGKPERGSVAGAYAGVAFGASDVSRGSFALPSPLSAPETRGPLVAGVFPSYGPDNGIAEWGMGWSASLSVTRWRATTDLDYQTDERTGPWGRMTRGQDGAWYPVGLLAPVRVVEDGAALYAHTSDGATWVFGEHERTETARGTYAWYLERVELPTGETTRLSYEANDSGRRFLTAVEYGGWGARGEYRIELAYEPTRLPFQDLRSGEAIALDRRVTKVRVLARDRVAGDYALRWTHALGYQEDPWGPGFYLTSVQRHFASGEAEPAFTYDYALGEQTVAEAAFRPLPELDALIAEFGLGVIQPHRAALLDIDLDGRVDLEHSERQTLLVRTDDGFETRELPQPEGEVYPACRPSPSVWNEPRLLTRMAAGDAEPRAVVLEPSWSGRSTLSICSREGARLHAEPLDGYWELSANTRLVDLNRDDQPDVLRVDPGSYEVLPNDSSDDGYAFGAARVGALEPMVYASSTWVHDFNGDGVPDLVALDGGQLVVWHGRGNFEFVAEGISYPVEDLHGLITALDGFEIYFVDANKDGVSDVLATRDFAVFLFVNDGYGLRERSVPAFESLDWSASEPVVADFAASGNAEISLTRDDMAWSMAIADASTGLLRSADDGKGTRVNFHYGRGPAEAGVEYRAAVLHSVELVSSGYDDLSYYYEYESPAAHSRARYLLGFDTVRRFGPQTAEEVRFHNDDEVTGLVLSSATTDRDTPDHYELSESDYTATDYRGLRWLRKRAERHGLASYDGQRRLMKETRYTRYDQLCATETQTESRGDVLTTRQVIAALPALAQAIHCLPSETSISGRHVDATLDFDTRESYQRNAIGQLTEVLVHGGGAPLVAQSIAYDALYRVESVTTSGRGTTRVSYAGDTRIVSSHAAPDGVATRITAIDPVRDLAEQIEIDRGASLAYAESFRHDGMERLTRRWDNLGASSEATPLESVAYAFPTADAPGVIAARELVDGATNVVRETASLVTASGESVAELSALADGWQVSALSRAIRASNERHELRRDPLRGALDGLDYEQLYQGAVAIGVARTSGLAHTVSSWSAVQDAVDREVHSEVTLDGDHVLITATENQALVTRSAVDLAGVMLWSEDQTGARTRFHYDASARLVGVTLADGTEHRLWFDDYGRPERIVRDGVGAVAYDYEPATSRIAAKRHLGTDGLTARTTAYVYDDIGRVTSEQHRDPASGETLAYDFEYDGDGHVEGQLGQLTAVRSADYEREFVFDANGRASQTTTTFPGWMRVVETNDYYADSSLRQVRRVVTDLRGGEVVEDTQQSFGYDALGRTHTMSVNGQVLATYRYGSEGEVTRLELPGGDQLWLSYDERTRDPNGYARVGPVAMSFDWTLNERALVAHEDLAVGERRWSRDHVYDARGYLIESSDRDQHSRYDYDQVGLPTSIRDLEGARQLVRDGDVLQAGEVTYRYDALGRVVQKGDLSLAYGPSGHLARAQRGDVTWSYVYDESGNRVLKREDGVIVGAFLEGGYLTDAGFYMPVRAAGQLLGLLHQGELIPVPSDPRGTVLADATGVPRIATPYGVRADAPDLAEIIDYAGKGYDRDLGTVRMGVRDYDPSISQFHTPDPLFLETLEECVGSPVECNLYGYAGNNPISYVDPTGLGFDSWLESTASSAWSGAKSAASFGGKVAAGVGKAAWGAAKGTYSAASHPIRTAQAIGHAVTHPRETAGAMYRSGKNSVAAIRSGDPDAIGEAIFDVGSMFVGVGAVAKVGQVAKLAKATRVARAVESTTAKVANVGRKVAARDGLDWDAVVPKKGKYQGQSRVDHVRLHNVDNPAKASHGVFFADGVSVTNEAWTRAQGLGLAPDAAGRMTVPMGRQVGWLGGEAGAAAVPLDSVTIIVRPGTNQVITAFPDVMP